MKTGLEHISFAGNGPIAAAFKVLGVYSLTKGIFYVGSTESYPEAFSPNLNGPSLRGRDHDGQTQESPFTHRTVVIYIWVPG